MIEEYKAFLFRGNVIDLAVAVVIGAAFGVIITSLVEDILTPLVGILGLPDFSSWVVILGTAEMRIGSFLNALLSFVLIGTAIFFLVVRPVQALQARRTQPVDTATGPTEVELLTQIRDELRRREAS